MPVITDNVIHLGKTGWDCNEMTDDTKSSLVPGVQSAYSSFPRGENKGHFSQRRRLILTLKAELIHLLLSGLASLQSKNKTLHSNPE